MTNIQGVQQPQMLEDELPTPEWLVELFNRRAAVNRYYAKTTPAEAKPGQAWALELPKHLIDPIIKESIMPVVLLHGYANAQELESDEGAWYAFLCWSPEPVSDRPIQDGELKPWISAKELTGRGELLSDPPVDRQAEWVLPLCPVYVKPEWLGKCVGDMKRDAAVKAYHHALEWAFADNRKETGAPTISETHRKNRVAGLSPWELVCFIRDCWEL